MTTTIDNIDPQDPMDPYTIFFTIAVTVVMLLIAFSNHLPK